LFLIEAIGRIYNDKYEGGIKMRILMNVRIPHEPFNTLVGEGKVGEILKKILKN